jgi:hypothetical protein
VIVRQTTFLPVQGTSPYTLPIQAFSYRLFAVALQITASVVVVDRSPILQVFDGGRNLCIEIAGVDLQTGQPSAITFCPGVIDLAQIQPPIPTTTAIVVAGFTENLVTGAFSGGFTAAAAPAFVPPLSQHIAIPQDLWIQPTWLVKVGVNNLDAGDTFGPLVISYDLRAAKDAAENLGA